MMWLDGDILQVYWNGYHHVAAYLGNILVWRENIRATQGIDYISTEVPSANTTLCLGISSKAFSRITQQSDANAVTPKTRNSKSTLHADVQVHSNAFARAARMPEGILPISVAPDLATVISALAKAAVSNPDHGFVPLSNSNACTSVPINIDTDTSFNPNSSTAQRRPAVPQTGESFEQFSTNNSKGTSVPKTLVHVDATEPNFIFDGQPTLKEPTLIKIDSPATAFQSTTPTTLVTPTLCAINTLETITSKALAEIHQKEDPRVKKYIEGTITDIIPEDFGSLTILPNSNLYRTLNITSVEYAEGVTDVGSQALWYNYALSYVIFPSTLNNIGMSFAGEAQGNSSNRITLDFTKYPADKELPTKDGSTSDSAPFTSTFIKEIRVPADQLDRWKAWMVFDKLKEKVVGV